MSDVPLYHDSYEKQFRAGLVFKARRLVVSLNSRPRVIKKKKTHHEFAADRLAPPLSHTK